MPASQIEKFRDDITADLDRVVSRFRPGVKVTLVVRNPDVPGDVAVIGNDELDDAIAEIRRRQAREAMAAADVAAKLTEIQRATLEHIFAFIIEHGVPPTIAELQEAFGIRSANCIWQRLNAMRKKGVLKHSPGVARGWSPT